MKYLLAVFASFAAVILVFRQWRMDLYATMQPAQLANIDTMMILVTLVIIAGALGIFACGYAIANRKPRTEIYTAPDAPIDTSWRPYKPPQPQISAPQTITIPRYQVMNHAAPLGITEHTATTPTAPPPMIRTVIDDSEIAVGLQYLVRYARMDTPTRTAWTGKPQLFYECQKLFDAHGMMQRTANNGRTWKQEYPARVRAQWLQQFTADHYPTGMSTNQDSDNE